MIRPATHFSPSNAVLMGYSPKYTISRVAVPPTPPVRSLQRSISQPARPTQVSRRVQMIRRTAPLSDTLPHSAPGRVDPGRRWRSARGLRGALARNGRRSLEVGASPALRGHSVFDPEFVEGQRRPGSSVREAQSLPARVSPRPQRRRACSDRQLVPPAPPESCRPRSPGG